MKKAIGLVLLLILAVGMLGLAQAAEETVAIPANDAVNGSITVSVADDGSSGGVTAEGDESNPEQSAGYLHAGTDGCYADGEGDFDDDDDNDGEPDPQTCQEAVESQIPA